jgi:Raf kinase inhibitor-like YbhB/YbcL family protein
MALTLKSSAFGQEKRIPDRHTCEGDDISPPLSWSGAPPRAQSFALVCSDPDAPMKTWYHWTIFDIPATTDYLDEGVAASIRVDGLRQAMSDFGRPGYCGPCPPKGHGEHHYRFTFWRSTSLPSRCRRRRTAATSNGRRRRTCSPKRCSPAHTPADPALAVRCKDDGAHVRRLGCSPCGAFRCRTYQRGHSG